MQLLPLVNALRKAAGLPALLVPPAVWRALPGLSPRSSRSANGGTRCWSNDPRLEAAMRHGGLTAAGPALAAGGSSSNASASSRSRQSGGNDTDDDSRHSGGSRASSGERAVHSWWEAAGMTAAGFGNIAASSGAGTPTSLGRESAVHRQTFSISVVAGPALAALPPASTDSAVPTRDATVADGRPGGRPRSGGGRYIYGGSRFSPAPADRPGSSLLRRARSGLSSWASGLSIYMLACVRSGSRITLGGGASDSVSSDIGTRGRRAAGVRSRFGGGGGSLMRHSVRLINRASSAASDASQRMPAGADADNLAAVVPGLIDVFAAGNQQDLDSTEAKLAAWLLQQPQVWRQLPPGVPDPELAESLLEQHFMCPITQV